MVDMNALLDTQADDVEAPKPMPVGEYTFRVSRYETGESSQKNTPFVRYFLQPIAAGDDVDEELLSEISDWQQKEMRVTFYITDKAMFMLRDFLENACQIEVEGKTFKELLPEAVGCEVIGTVTQQEGQGGRPFNPDVQRLQPVE